jgi:hypothetical protein
MSRMSVRQITTLIIPVLSGGFRMNGVQAIQASLGSTQFLLTEYIKDLSDADLLVRPVPGANHIAWQLGHLIVSEGMIYREQIGDVAYPALPGDFAEVHKQEAAANDGPAGFRSKSEYVALFNAVRGATIAHVGKLTDADLDRPTQGRMAPFAPKLGNILLLLANHTLMHAGQFTALRRKLGKPILF